MKKLVGKIVLSVMLFLMSVMLLTGCGGQVEGTYKFDSMTYVDNGMTVTVEAGENYMNMITLTEDYITITLDEDGLATLIMSGESPIDGSWKQKDGDKIELIFGGGAQVCDCNGKTLTIEIDGSEITLKK